MKDKKEAGEGIEDLLISLRKEKDWSYVELISQFSNKTITTKKVRKWELGLEYPDLDEIYELSSIYKEPSSRFIEAKNNSFSKGIGSINMRFTKWLCYFLNISFHAGMVLMTIFYIFALIFAFLFFISMAYRVKR